MPPKTLNTFYWNKHLRIAHFYLLCLLSFQLHLKLIFEAQIISSIICVCMRAYACVPISSRQFRQSVCFVLFFAKTLRTKTFSSLNKLLQTKIDRYNGIKHLNIFTSGATYTWALEHMDETWSFRIKEIDEKCAARTHNNQPRAREKQNQMKWLVVVSIVLFLFCTFKHFWITQKSRKYHKNTRTHSPLCQ